MLIADLLMVNHILHDQQKFYPFHQSLYLKRVTIINYCSSNLLLTFQAYFKV